MQGISLLAAFFGLCDIEEILLQCGLSRFPRVRVATLDTLSHEEASSAIQGFFDAYDFDVPDRMCGCMNWPNCLRAGLSISTLLLLLPDKSFGDMVGVSSQFWSRRLNWVKQ
ncbi:MAG: hypothetical protein OXD01_10435 [Gammaproteobacteria bacterium]|nr:hypothetical protein [Gammaproteobacteria bacterium]